MGETVERSSEDLSKKSRATRMEHNAPWGFVFISEIVDKISCTNLYLTDIQTNV